MVMGHMNSPIGHKVPGRHGPKQHEGRDHWVSMDRTLGSFHEWRPWHGVDHREQNSSHTPKLRELGWRGIIIGGMLGGAALLLVQLHSCIA